MSEKLTVALSADIKDLKQSLDKANGLLNKFANDADGQSKSINKNFNGIGNVAKSVGGIVAGAFTIGAMVQFGKAVVDTTAKFQKFEAVLSNTLGSNSAAQLAMQSIVDFASKTPFQVDELTGAFVKLANQGFKPTIKEMTSLGDLASSTGKSFDQLVEAILDAQTGEFERLKEFGIRAKDMGDKVQFTFKGVKTEVDKTAEAMRGYILSLGTAEGVSGAMDKISKTLGGQLSNLSDNWTMLMKNIGDSNTGVLSKTTGLLNEMVGALNTIGNADNIAEKLGIDQRGKTWIDNVPFAELQNLWGGITVGQSANLLLAESYDKLGKQIAEATTKADLQNLITIIKNTRNELEKGSPTWVVYNQRLIDASEALNGLTREQNKQNEAKKEEIRLIKEKLALQNKEKQKLSNKMGASFDTSINNVNPNAEVDLSKLTPPTKEINDYQAQLNLLSTGLSGIAVIGQDAFNTIKSNIVVATDTTKQKLTELQEIGLSVSNSFANNIGNAFASAIIDGENFGDAMGKVLQQLGRDIIAQIVRMLALRGIMYAFGGLFPTQIGQVATNATVGLVGGRINTNVNTGNSAMGNVEFVVRGNNLVGALNANSSRNSRLR